MECNILSGQMFERPVLDIGCGDGIFASVLFAETIDTGIDPDPDELVIARELGAYEELICCGGDAIPKPDESYATVFANSVLEHISDLEPVVEEVFRVLRPGGAFYVTIPTHRFEQYTLGNLLLVALRVPKLAARWRRFFKSFWNLYNVNHPSEWKHLFEKAGFEVRHSFEYEPRSLYLLKELLMPFSVPGAVNKRLRDRWVILPLALRRVTTAPVAMLGKAMIGRWSRAERGCLLFVELRKPRA